MALDPDRAFPSFDPAIAPIPSRSRRPPKDWADVVVEEDQLKVKLSGWRAVVGFRRTLSVPLAKVTSAAWDPSVYSSVPTSLRPRRSPRSHLYRVGVYRGRRGWSFWACGLGRNAVVIETDQFRFRFIVVERHDSADVVAMLHEALERRKRHGRDGAEGGEEDSYKEGSGDGERP